MGSFIVRAAVGTLLVGLAQAPAQAQPAAEPLAAGDKAKVARFVNVKLPARKEGSLLLYQPRRGTATDQKEGAAYGLYVPAGKCVPDLKAYGRVMVVKVEPKQDCDGVTGKCRSVASPGNQTLDLPVAQKFALSDSCKGVKVTGGRKGAEYLVVQVLDIPLQNKEMHPLTLMNADKSMTAQLAAPQGMKGFIVAKASLVALDDGKGLPEPIPSRPPPPPPGPIFPGPEDFLVKPGVNTWNVARGVTPTQVRGPSM